jgi:hypothetical protein
MAEEVKAHNHILFKEVITLMDADVTVSQSDK